MDQLKQLLERLSVKQQITIGVAIVAVIAGLVSLSRWNKERDFRPLFTSLAPEDAGQVVAKIRESGTEIRLTEGGTTVLVPSDKVAELRLQLASAGLPKSGRLGFELFDKVNFGATDFTEQVNYHRALEGELERSVMSLAEVEHARVHITFPKDSIYTESKQPAKASVMLKLRPGAKLSPQNILAVCHLTASAVEGLQPEAVSVLDMNGNLLSRPRKPGLDGEPSEALIEFRQKLERDVLNKINGTLEPLLGSEKYRAAVAIDCDFTSGEQSEELYDPTKSVMVTSQRIEDGTTSAGASGVPGTASNLPRPTSRPGGGSGGTSRRSENIAYQSSRLVKHLKLPQGNIKRMSVSVLLDQDVRFDKGKRIIEPPTPEKLKVVKDLVSGVTGLVNERGDQIIVETFPFEATLRSEPPTAAPVSAPNTSAPAWGPPWLQQLMKQKNFALIAGAAGGAVVLLLVALIFMLTRKGKVTATMAKTVRSGADQKALAEPARDIEAELESRLAEQLAIKEQQAKEVLAQLKLPPVATKKTEVLLKHIVTETKKDPEVMANVVRSWLTADNN
jgi:flagellar M-ring protein FliF